jgi:transcription antitermination factor NusG
LLSSFPFNPFSVWLGPAVSRPANYHHPSEDGEALRRFSSDNLQANVAGNIAAAEISSQWFAVYTTCRHEKRVAQYLVQRSIEHYLPLYRVDRKWRDGSRVTLELPLFPSYIFARIRRSERVTVLNVPGALAVVGGTGGEPAPVPDSAIESLKTGLLEHRVEPHPLLRAGQMARIRSGAFAGMEGIVIRTKGACRVVLTIEQIMQSIAVEVDASDLECVTSNGHSFLAANCLHLQ